MEEKKYVSISLINKAIKNVIDAQPFLNKVYLKGEISNFKGHTRGHLYFTLKDESSRISAVMFASAASSLTFTPADGMNVLVEGLVFMKQMVVIKYTLIKWTKMVSAIYIWNMKN